MDIVKVSIMGICGMMLGFILKETRPEFAALVTMMTGFLILGLAAGKVSYPVSYTHLRAHETDSYLVCRLLLEKKKKKINNSCIFLSLL